MEENKRVPNDMQMRIHETEDESVESPTDSSVGLSPSTKTGMKYRCGQCMTVHGYHSHVCYGFMHSSSG